MSSAVHEEGPPERHTLALRASGPVLCAGSVAEVFGTGDRAVLRVEQDGAEDEELLLLRLRHGLFALVNRCPHAGRALDDGRVHGHVLQCRGHGRSYSLRTGRATGTMTWGGPPKLRRVPVWIQDGQLFLDVSGIVSRS